MADASAGALPEAMRIEKMIAWPAPPRARNPQPLRRTPEGRFEVVTIDEEPEPDEHAIQLRVSLVPPPPSSPVDHEWWHTRFAEQGLTSDGGAHGPHEFQLWFRVPPDELEGVARKVIAVVGEAAPSYQAELKSREERRAAEIQAKRQQMAPYQAILDRLMAE